MPEAAEPRQTLRFTPLTETSTGQDAAFRIGEGVVRAARVRAQARRPDDPGVRPLRVLALDPAASRLDGCVAVVDVPYERLTPGPVGALLAVDDEDGGTGQRLAAVDLDDPHVLLGRGRGATATDPQFHQQMVYAVCARVIAEFRRALGRQLSWGFDAADTGSRHGGRLVIRPHAFVGENAFYDEERGELRFGYYRAAPRTTGRNMPGSWVFTCLSHDVVAHEVTHALLHGLRADFTVPTGPDVLAFHEAFADIVALLTRFSYADVVRAALRKSRGDVGAAELLTDVARQFGQTMSAHSAAGQALRSALDTRAGGEDPSPYDTTEEPHDRGASLVAAVFEAFRTVYKRRTEPYVRLATGGSGVLPPGELSRDLLDILTKEAGKLAGQFLRICVRAIDYCPPVDVEFGEYLRAVITADHDLVPEDPLAYREAWIDAFRRRAIFPRDVPNLSEDALRWGAPQRDIPPVTELAFAALQFDGDPGCPANVQELQRQAHALGRVVTDPRWADEFGLLLPGNAPPGLGRFEPAVVQSIRSSRRAGPDGQVVFDLVAEVTQRYWAPDPAGVPFPFLGGATVIVGPDGAIRYVVRKRVLHEPRQADQRAFLAGRGERLWERAEGQWRPRPLPFRLVHEPDASSPSAIGTA
jgi:hypothetical protein